MSAFRGRLRADGATVPEIIRRTKLSKASVYRAWGCNPSCIVTRLDLIMGICDKCGERLIEIDYYGERLTGCGECNKWGRLGDTNRVLELKEDDLAAVRERPRT